MKSIVSLFLTLILCALCFACAEAPEKPEEPATSSTPAASSTCREENVAMIEPASPVRIEIDGEPIGFWSDLLYRIYDGVVSDGPLMFGKPAFEKIPDYTLGHDLHIFMDGMEKQTVTVCDPETGAAITTGRPTATLQNDLAPGRYLIVFDYKTTKNAAREGDCSVTSYYFYLTIPESFGETTAIRNETTATTTGVRHIHSFIESDAGDGVTYHECTECGYWYYSYGGGTAGWMSDANTTAVA